MKQTIAALTALMLILAANTSHAASNMKTKIKVSGGSTYDYFIIGEMEGATDGFDNAYDTICPGSSMNDLYIFSYLPHPEWGKVKSDFRADIRSIAETQEWTAGIYTNLPNGTVLTMSLMENSVLPSEYSIKLEDIENGAITDITKTNYSFTVTNNTTVRMFKLTATAALDPKPINRYNLTVSSINGSVSANTGALVWNNNTGTAAYDENTEVILTALPSAGYSLGSWTGCDTISESTCNVLMTADKNISVSCTLNRYNLTVTTTGTGTVSSSPSGISCGTDCNETYDYGTKVTLTATAGSGYTFSGYTGDADCSDGSLTMYASKTCNATFACASVYTLSSTSKTFSSKAGSGSVKVTKNGSCGTWTAKSNDSWITITSGSSGNGKGTVKYKVSANTSAGSRTGTITIAGKTFTVNQNKR